MSSSPPLGVTVMPEWFQCEGIASVLDRVQAMGATAIATSPYVLEVAPDGEGGREPPADGDAGRVRPLNRPLFGRTELWVRTAPAFVHEPGRYAGLRYQPSPPSPVTARHAGLLDDVLAAATARGIAVYLQVMAASPPGYRVQFSSAMAEDQCLGPDFAPHLARVDRNASLASSEVVAYVVTLVTELAERYPTVAGFRLDWPEYPPYDARSALFDFNPAATKRMEAAGSEPRDVARAAQAWWFAMRNASRAAPQGPAAAGAALDTAGWGALFGEAGALAPLLAAKRGAARALLAAVRTALDGIPGARRRLEPQAFPPPFHRISGFPLGDLAGIADAIGIKLYTMHWPMIARYWARDFAESADAKGQDALTAAIAKRFALVDEGAADVALHYPEPHEAHPVGVRAQQEKLQTAQASTAGVPVTAFVHSYGPITDVVARYELAARTSHALWFNRYGYLSDAKIDAIAAARGMPPILRTVGRTARPS
jgi:hypothetical protein